MNYYKRIDEKIIKSWVKYNQQIDELIEKAKYRGEDISWNIDRIESLEQYVLEYKQQQQANKHDPIHKYKRKENITRQLVQASKIYKTPEIQKFAKFKGISTKKAKKELSGLSRQELYDLYFYGIADEDYDVAAAFYKSALGKHINPGQLKALNDFEAEQGI